MPISFSQNFSATQDGIKSIGVGKKGSKDLNEEQVRAITEELVTSSVPEIVKGAFFGALVIKGVQPHEEPLEKTLIAGAFTDYSKLVESLSKEAPYRIKSIATQLLNREELDKDVAFELGRFLFSEEPGDSLRGLAASILRVRYETLDEYEGLLEAIEKTFNTVGTGFKPVPTNQSKRKLIQFAEPFDGVDHSFVITPLICEHFAKRGYTTFALTGENPGPKNVYNLCDVATELKSQFLTNPSQLVEQRTENPAQFLNLSNLSTPLARWIEFRRQIVKRPFLSTLERLVNPANAKVVVASAFHPPYGEKMLNICERAGYASAVIVRNGLEGGLAFPLLRNVKILATVKNDAGCYERREFEFNPKDYGIENVTKEEKYDPPDFNENIRLIKTFQETSTTDNHLFNLRVKYTCEGLTEVLEWISKETS